MVSQYTILPLFGVTTTRPGSLPTALAAKIPNGRGSVDVAGAKGSLNENRSLVASVVDDELWLQIKASECVRARA